MQICSVNGFDDPEKAAEFASRNRIYARPCTVETVDDTPP